MSDNGSDEFPDIFEGVDWDVISQSIPSLSFPNEPVMQGQGSISPNYRGCSTELPANSVSSTSVAASTSSDEYQFDEVDQATLDQISLIEAAYLSKTNSTSADPLVTSQSTFHPSTSASQDTSDYLHRDCHTSSLQPNKTSTSSTNYRSQEPHPTPSSSQKRRIQIEEEAGPSNKRFRASSPVDFPRDPRSDTREPRITSSLDQRVERVLRDFEDELACPICCDIMVCAHLGNPCGHSYCGQCGWDWLSKNKSSPTCAVCRSKLSPTTSMIPNFAMDNTVEKHIQVLSNSGVSDWGPHGKKFLDWTSRRSHWKKMVQEQEAKAKTTAGSSRDVQVTSNRSHDSVQQTTSNPVTGDPRLRESAQSFEAHVVPTNQREPPRRRRPSRRSRHPQDHNNGTGHNDNTANPRRRSRRR